MDEGPGPFERDMLERVASGEPYMHALHWINTSAIFQTNTSTNSVIEESSAQSAMRSARATVKATWTYAICACVHESLSDVFF